MAPRQLRLDLPEPAKARIAAGIDEAGRGCLAGPVVAAAVILPDVYELPGLDDSKRLSAKKRGFLEHAIKTCAIAWSIGVVWPWRIDVINILNATLEAMARAASSLAAIPELLLIDGNCKIPSSIMDACWPAERPQPQQRAIISGDSLEKSISAASILAKTFRDRLMLSFDGRYPQYGFCKHKGYGTREHLEALALYGPCAIHRKTFRGVQAKGAKPI